MGGVAMNTAPRRDIEALHEREQHEEDATRNRGRSAYETDCAKTPRYHDGAKRKAWGELGAVEQWSWTRPPLA